MLHARSLGHSCVRPSLFLRDRSRQCNSQSRTLMGLLCCSHFTIALTVQCQSANPPRDARRHTAARTPAHRHHHQEYINHHHHRTTTPTTPTTPTTSPSSCSSQLRSQSMHVPVPASSSYVAQCPQQQRRHHLEPQPAPKKQHMLPMMVPMPTVPPPPLVPR